MWGESDETAYVTPQMKLYLRTKRSRAGHCPGQVGTLPPSQQYLVVRRGDRLLLGDEFKVGSPARYDEHGKLLRTASIGCTLPSVFRDLKHGERVLFDDGKIGACVQEVRENCVVLEVTHAADHRAETPRRQRH